MARSARELFEEASQLPPAEINWLIESLLIKESEEPQAEVQAAWDAEIKRRLDEIDSGAVKLISGDEVRAEMLSQIQSEKQTRRRA